MTMSVCISVLYAGVNVCVYQCYMSVSVLVWWQSTGVGQPTAAVGVRSATKEAVVTSSRRLRAWWRRWWWWWWWWWHQWLSLSTVSQDLLPVCCEPLIKNLLFTVYCVKMTRDMSWVDDDDDDDINDCHCQLCHKICYLSTVSLSLRILYLSAVSLLLRILYLSAVILSLRILYLSAVSLLLRILYTAIHCVLYENDNRYVLSRGRLNFVFVFAAQNGNLFIFSLHFIFRPKDLCTFCVILFSAQNWCFRP